MGALPRVAVIFTGGTIDSIGTDRLDLAWYNEAGMRLEQGELLARIPELQAIAQVEEVPFRRLPSHALTPKDLLDLNRTVHELLETHDGVVITHGTNTLEETAYFLHLTLKSDKPVVVVGAMRPSSALSADGYLNLLEAVRVAATPEARGKGALVVLNDTILSARDATKTATYRLQTFQGRDLGPLGYADADGRVLFYHLPARKHTTQTEFDVWGLDDLPRVDVVLSYIGADGALIDAAVAAGARGIVSAGTGAGRPTPLEDAALARAQAQGVVIVQGTRVGTGRAVRSPGLVRKGWIATDNLQPWKAKLLLALGLTVTQDADRLQQMFDAY
jgi:L-asparaginase